MVKVRCKPISEFPGRQCHEVQDGAGSRMMPTKDACGDQPSCAPDGGPNCMWCIYDDDKCDSVFGKAACDRTRALMKKMGVSCKAPDDSDDTKVGTQGWRPSLVMGLVFMGGAAGAGAGALATYLVSRSSG